MGRRGTIGAPVRHSPYQQSHSTPVAHQQPWSQSHPERRTRRGPRPPTPGDGEQSRQRVGCACRQTGSRPSPGGPFRENLEAKSRDKSNRGKSNATRLRAKDAVRFRKASTSKAVVAPGTSRQSSRVTSPSASLGGTGPTGVTPPARNVTSPRLNSARRCRGACACRHPAAPASNARI